MKIEFRLNEFRKVANWVGGKLPPPVAFFVKAWIWRLEEWYIDAAARAAVDKGIAPVAPPEPVVEPPRHLSEPSEVEGLDIIGYSYEFARTREEDQD